MASAFVSSHSPSAYPPPTLKYYFSGTTFKQVSSYSRPSSSASNYPSPDSPYYDSPYSPRTHIRPLPTPPGTPPRCNSPSRSPRPLPSPPPFAQSPKRFRADPLPTPPVGPPPILLQPIASTSTRPRPAPLPLPPAPTERPAIRLDIPTLPATPASHMFTTPSSPIAFSISGPRDSQPRKRREEELDRRIKILDFVDASPPRTGRKFSISPVESESDNERGVVLLVDEVEDEDVPPMRSESRAAMRRLFADGGDDAYRCSLDGTAESEGCCRRPSIGDIEVEVVSVARTKQPQVDARAQGEALDGVRLFRNHLGAPEAAIKWTVLPLWRFAPALQTWKPLNTAHSYVDHSLSLFRIFPVLSARTYPFIHSSQTQRTHTYTIQLFFILYIPS